MCQSQGNRRGPNREKVAMKSRTSNSSKGLGKASQRSSHLSRDLYKEKKRERDISCRICARFYGSRQFKCY